MNIGIVKVNKTMVLIILGLLTVSYLVGFLMGSNNAEEHTDDISRYYIFTRYVEGYIDGSHDNNYTNAITSFKQKYCMIPDYKNFCNELSKGLNAAEITEIR